MTGEAAEAIRDAIREHGPITFAELMDRALYGPGGFYEHPPVGAHGDFVTSPHVHPVFATLLARAIRGLWEDLGRPVPYRVTEVGAGDGTLAGRLLDELSDLPFAYTALEASPGARAALERIDGITVATELEPEVDLVVANEVLDNLPFRVIRRGREVRVGLVGDRFAEVEVELDEGLAELVPTIGEDAEVVPVGALDLVDRIAGSVRRGHALVIDYGAVGSTGGTVHGYRAHRIVEDVLAAPGSTDITAGVDFAVVAERARTRGLVAFATVTQHDALLALGLEAWLRAELDRQRQHLDSGEGASAVRAWSGRSRATLLVDPAGLGRFLWLLIATEGLPRPDWLDARPRPD